MHTLARPDGILVYDIVGSGPPLVLVTGLGGSRHYWNSLLPSLRSKFTVVTYDHMGTGDTTSHRSQHTIEKLADDTLAIMDAIGLREARLMGHSTGAAVGLVLSARAPERISRLVLYAGWAGPDPHFSLCFQIRKRLLLAAGVEAYHRATPLFLFPPKWISASSEGLTTLIQDMISASPRPEVLEARIDMLLSFDYRNKLHKIINKPLIICADDDFLTPLHCSQELADKIAGSHLVQMDWGGHAVSQTCPEAFLDAVGPGLS